MPEPSPTSFAGAPAAPKPARALAPRLFSTVLLWAIIIGALMMRVAWPLVALVAVFGWLGALEYARLQAGDTGARPYTRVLLALAAAYWIGVGWQAGWAAREPSWLLDATALAAAVHGACLVAFLRPIDGERTLRHILNTVFGFVYTTLSFGFLVRILFLDGAGRGARLLLFVVLVVKAGDMAAYAAGTLFGRHKMMPHISPAKTWEGFAGAVAGSCLAAAGMMAFDAAGLAPLTWANLPFVAVVLCLVGVVGDLAESILKRCHGVKDSGHALPGIGGILDLTDSLLFAAPVGYFCLRALAAA